MSTERASKIPVWGIPRANAGYLYVIESNGRLKIGKSKNRETRIRAARTWLPDMTVIGVKPFWQMDALEYRLHEGLAQWWYEGEWFDFGDDPYKEDFLHDFRAFQDDDAERDMNSINAAHWMSEMIEIAMEHASRDQSLRAFQRELSDTKRESKKIPVRKKF